MLMMYISFWTDSLSDVNNLKIPVVFLIYPFILSLSENLSLYMPIYLWFVNLFVILYFKGLISSLMVWWLHIERKGQSIGQSNSCLYLRSFQCSGMPSLLFLSLSIISQLIRLDFCLNEHMYASLILSICFLLILSSFFVFLFFYFKLFSERILLFLCLAITLGMINALIAYLSVISRLWSEK